MMISTKGRYALMIMSYLANHRDELVSLKDIAEHQGIGIKYLEIIISSLNKADMVNSVRGKKGGYRLSKNPEEYTIYEIISAAEGDLRPVPCVVEGFCQNAESCKTHKIWLELDDLITDFFTSKTLKDIM